MRIERQRLRFVAGALALVVLAGAYWPLVIDDAFISAAYAHELAAGRGLAWPGGDRIEGYSNFAWVLLMAAVARLGGDVIVWAKLASLASGVSLLAVASRSLPMRREGDLAFAALVVWSPLAYWSAMPLEAATFGLLVVLGWIAAIARRPGGMGWLVLASLLRPEGALWLVVAGAVQLRAPLARHRRRRAAGFVAASLLVVLAYHAWRVWHFGALLPAAVWLKAMVGWFVVPQLIAEALAGAGLLAASALFAVKRRAWLGWLPLALAVITLVAMNGDWMARGRILLPGAAAFLIARARLGEVRAGARRRWLALALIVAASAIEPRFLELPRLRALLPRYHQGLETPLWAPLEWLVRHAPDGAVVQSADVGILGHVPRMTVVDARGLVSRRFLEARQRRDYGAVAGWYAGPERPDVIQISRYLPEDILAFEPLTPYQGLDPWLRSLDGHLAAYPHHDDVFYAEGSWRAAIRFHRIRNETPALSVQIDRWRGLSERFPSQPFLAWQLAMALAAEGRLDEALAVARAGDDGGEGPLDDVPASLSLPLGDTSTYAPGRGFLVRSRRSWPLRAESMLALEADEPFAVELSWEPLDAACADVPPPRAFSGGAGRHRIRLEPSCRARLSITAEPPVWAALR